MTPFEQWYKVTSDASWKDKTPEDKEAIRNGFVDKFSEGQPEEARRGFEWATRDLEKDVFSDPAFQSLEETEQKKYITANLASNKGLKGERALGIFSEAAHERFKGSAAVAGVKRIPLAANQLRVNISPFADKTDEAKANTAVSDNEKVAKRDENLALVGEIGANAALPSGAFSKLIARGGSALRSLPYVGKLAQAIPAAAVVGAETAITSPVDVKGGTPEEQRGTFWDTKINQTLLGASAGIAGEAITSPIVKNKVGDAKRWVQGVNIFDSSAKGKTADIADDLLKRTYSRFPDLSQGAINSDLKQMVSEVSKINPEDAAVKIPEILGKYKTGQELLVMQGSTPVPDLQTFVLDNFADKAVKTANKGLPNVSPTSTEGVSGRFFDRYVKPQRVEVKKGLKKAVDETETAFTESSNTLYKTLEGTDLAVTKEELAKRTKAFLERPDVAPQLLTIEGNPAIGNILNKTTKGKEKTANLFITPDSSIPVSLNGKNTPLTAKNLQEYIQQTFESLEGVAGTPTKAFVEEVLKPALGQNAAKQVDDVYAQYQKMSAKKEIDLLNIKEEGARNLVKIKKENPLLGTLSDTMNEAELGTKATALFKDNKVSRKHFDVLQDEDKKAVSSLVLADVSDIFMNKNLEAEKVDALVTFFEKYGKSKDTITYMFKGTDEEKTLASLYKIAEGADNTLKNTATSFKEGGAEVQKGLTREFTGVSSLTIGQVDKLVDRLQRQTRKLLRESSIDKQKMLGILSSAEKIGAGQNVYKNLWSVGLGARQDALKAGMVGVDAGGNEAYAGEEQKPVVAPEAPVATPEETLPPQSSLEGQDSLTGASNNDIIPTVEDDIAKAGLSPAYLKYAMDLTGAESGHSTDVNLPTFNDETGKPASSAKGPAQILDGTWDDMSKLAEKKIGRPLDKTKVSDHILAAALYGKQNYNFLKANGYPTNAKDLYVAHVWGSAGADRLYGNMGKGVLAKHVLTAKEKKNNPSYAVDGFTVDQVLAATKNAYTAKSSNTTKQAKLKEAAANG